MLKSLAGGEYMAKEAGDRVLSALKKYEQDPDRNDKKAVLLTPQGGYFLYGNRFCSIAEYELELCSESLQLQGKTVPKPLFFSVHPRCFQITGEQACEPKLVSLIFQISLEDDEPLRGILLALEREAELVLFSDVAVETLYRLALKTGTQKVKELPPNEELLRYAEKLRQNDLHGLTSLYLKGEQLKSLVSATSYRK